MKDYWRNELPPVSPTTDGSDHRCRIYLSDKTATQTSRPLKPGKHLNTGSVRG